MKTILVLLMVLFYSLMALCHSSSASNLAYLKQYKVSPAPNYQLSAPSIDKTSLTDGKFSSGFFWTQKTTIGWRYIKNAEILIDLGKISDIGSLTFNTARGLGSEVYFPAHVYAFIGTETNHFSYVGDVVKSPDNTTGSYKVEKFELPGIKAKGRYVLLEAVPRGNFLFCDEIEVLAPNGSGKTMQVAESSISNNTSGDLDIEAARNLAKQLERLDIEKEFLQILLGEVTSSSAGHIGDAQIAGIKQSIDALVSLTIPNQSRRISSNSGERLYAPDSRESNCCWNPLIPWLH